MKRFACRDIGADCDWVIEATSEEELYRRACEHGAEQHGLKSVSKEMEQRIRSHIQTV